MSTHLLALVHSTALILGSGAIRTDGLSAGQLKVWKRILAIVMAEARDGRPLHPILRQLWDGVDAGEHVIQVQILDRRKKSHVAGQFTITRLDPDGVAREGILSLNPRTVDVASTGPMDAREDGFVPFRGLVRDERYAEVLGHELAHAAWCLADPGRARFALRFQNETAEMGTALPVAGLAAPPARPERVRELQRVAVELERPAEAAEEAIWKELQAGRRAPRAK